MAASSSSVNTSTSSTNKAGSTTTAPTSEQGNGGRSVLICVLRLDLRVHDNALFHYAHRTAAPPTSQTLSDELRSSVSVGVKDAFSRWADESCLHSHAQYLLPLYVFDEREMELSGLPGFQRKGPEARTREYGFWKTGGFRARFIAESVYDLRSRLRERGSDLLIRFGRPEDVVANLVTALQTRGDFVEAVWMQKEITHAEIQVEESIRIQLDRRGVALRFVHGKTLVHPADLPFDVKDTPDVFTPFRKRVESVGPGKMVRPTLDAPQRFKPILPDVPETSDYKLDVTYEVDVDGLKADLSNLPVGDEQQQQGSDQISFYDILRYLLLPLNDTRIPLLNKGDALLQQRNPASAFPLRGGESSALDRMEWYFIRGKSSDSSRWDRDDPPPVARYKQTRNNLVGHAYSTKMSPFLAYGSVSARQIWEALDYHEQKFGEDQNTYWVRFELLWRDYFFFVAEKFGNLLFELGGFELATDPAQAEKKLKAGWWRGWEPSRDGARHEVTRLLEGRTGIPFIDANVIELRESGFMSNRGRQNVASFLSKDLGCDWRIGAEFFQSHLIDYDPTSNYGNWQYVAGVGNDPRASRQFNTIKQAKDYDSHGEYVKTWIPALRSLHPDYVHTPWLLDDEERRRYGLKTTDMHVTLVAYPECPMLELDSWRKHYERKEGVGSKMRGNPQEKVKDAKLRRLRMPHRASTGSGGAGGSVGGSGGGYHSSRGFTAGGQYALGQQRSGESPQLSGQAVQEQHYNHSHAYDYLASSSGYSTTPTWNDSGRSMLAPLRGGAAASESGRRSPAVAGTGHGVSTGPLPGSAGAAANRAASRGLVGGVLGSAGGRSPSLAAGFRSGASTPIADAQAQGKADTEPSWRRNAP